MRDNQFHRFSAMLSAPFSPVRLKIFLLPSLLAAGVAVSTLTGCSLSTTQMYSESKGENGWSLTGSGNAWVMSDQPLSDREFNRAESTAPEIEHGRERQTIFNDRLPSLLANLRGTDRPNQNQEGASLVLSDIQHDGSTDSDSRGNKVQLVSATSTYVSSSRFNTSELANEVPTRTRGLNSTSALRSLWRYPQQSRPEPDWNQVLLRARQLERSEQWTEAIAAYQQVRNKADDRMSVIAAHRLAVLFSRRNQPERALSEFKFAVAHDRHNADLLCDYGYHYQLNGDLGAAAYFYRHALDVNGGHERSHNHLGVLSAMSDHIDGAMQHFMAAGLSPDQARHNLGLIVKK